MKSYATTDDLISLRGPQNAEALERLGSILEVISSQFRVEARSYGKDLDAMVEADEDLMNVTRCLVVDGAMNYYASSQSNEAPMSQFAQSAMGYSISGSYANPGGGLYTKKTWLKLLGINRQKVGKIEMFDFGGTDDQGHNSNIT